MSWSTIETLCLALNCTPNDMYEWKPKKVVAKDHALNKLNKDRLKHFNELMSSLPFEKLLERLEE